MSSKVVFMAFTQHFIQSNVTHVRGVKDVLYSVYSGLSPLPGGKAISKAFCLGGFTVHHQLVWGGSFFNFLGLVKLQGWLQARHTANPQFLKLRVLSNPVILRYLQTKLHPHTLTKLPAQCNFDPKSVFNAWRLWACRVPLEVAGSVSGKVGSHEQVDLPIHRLQLWMLGCQLSQTHLSLIAHTWPIFDQSRSCTPCEPPAQSSSRLVLAWLIK